MMGLTVTGCKNKTLHIWLWLILNNRMTGYKTERKYPAPLATRSGTVMREGINGAMAENTWPGRFL
ncbi:hypothetical protein ASY01nite_21530 [Acetobacter syzygii]|uniref:Uncharacterized protein n=1 Tax=Acetobacter syzygii TaxID=146476 RepID=A0A270BR15_9PROT|nr:hypothetical protein B9K05_04185 [Acetobacter syzygii]PAL27816.1 hypothetical protein B9K04_03335 [Acetobacter syzygii]GAN70406.1 hypothetical protein Absy_006_050 [Acetobacter syzygii]GEL57087.1 hypothetical protein ASY01nite_21530 [Acetobacter syzygii]